MRIVPSPSGGFNLDYDHPVQVAPGVWWVGFYDAGAGLHCNPYLIVDGDEAVVVDGGSRPDFPRVMTKILQTGTRPSAICALVLSHYDPDLCGSLANFEDLIRRPDLQVLSHSANHMFIRHFQIRSRLVAVDETGWAFRFRSGRTLAFHGIPYCHAPGSTVAFDAASGVLFSSDLFGSYGHDWEIFLTLPPECLTCQGNAAPCAVGKKHCPLRDILRFHEKTMPSRLALHHALEVVSRIPFTTLAPQHGSVLRRTEDITAVFEALLRLEQVGIEGVPGAAMAVDPGNRQRVLERLGAR